MLRVRMTDEEKRMLATLTKGTGLTASDIVRLLIRERHAERKAEKRNPKK
jgi:predicted DNA-binding protein